jgi:molecular chaperone Hsp33
MSNTLKKFLFEDRRIRVCSVHLEDVWQQTVARQSYHPAVQNVLGELLAAATLLASSLKFDGSLLLQIQGTGPIRLLVVECRADMSFRTTVKMSDQAIDEHNQSFKDLIDPDGLGRFVVILKPPEDNPDRQPYQGVIALEGSTVAQVLEFYMMQSEQLETRLWLASNGQQCAGLMLQKMPEQGGLMHEATAQDTESDSWALAVNLCETLSQDDLLTLDQDTRLHRLFWQTPVLNLENTPVTWRCGCSRARVMGMLQMLGQTEVETICTEQGHVTVSCEFCNTPYIFDRVDVAILFTPPVATSGNTLH